MTDYAWNPTPAVVAAANSSRFARAHGLAGFAELLERSVEDPAWFWDAMVSHLGVRFAVPYERVVDSSEGIAWTRWFVGGRLNLAWNCVDRHVEAGHGAREAIRSETEDGAVRVLTFAELAVEVARFAGALRGLGVGIGDRVALMMPFTADALVAWYAITRLGAVVVPIFSGFATPAIAVRLQDSAAKLVVIAAATTRRGKRLPLRDAVCAAIELAPSVETLVVHGGMGGACTPPCREVAWEDVVRAATPAEAVVVDSEHPLMIGYTSGTTGAPKGAVHCHAGLLVKHATEVYFAADVQDGDALMWFTDMGWIMAPWIFIGAHALGQTLVMYDGAADAPSPDRVWRVVERHRVSFLGVSPSLIRSLQPHGAGLPAACDLSHLRLFGSAGEPWNPEPYRWLADEVGRGLRPIINISGGTEVGSCFLSCDISQPIKPCSLGGPALGMAMSVYDDVGAPVATGELGELVCTRPWPSMTRGIWGDPERYLEAYWRRFPGVWVHGDWASIDIDGQWFLHGRSDDALNIAGKRIGSSEYESALVAHPAVIEACTIGMPHPIKGETAWCFAVLTADAMPTDTLRTELSRNIESQLGKAFRVDRICFTRSLPKTRSQKIVRRAVRAIALDTDPGDLSTLEDPTALDHIRTAIGETP